MKVYALWHEENGYEYRWRTILQFGTSWNVIGSVYMKNPGSAYPIAEPDNIALEHLKNVSNSAEWKEFKKDRTMECIKSLFQEYKRTQSLNGVIKIFNLFNLRNADLDTALKDLENGKCNNKYLHTFDDDLNNLKFPVYIGWKDLWKKQYFKKNYETEIKSIYAKAKKLSDKKGKKWYLADTLEDPKNRFWHPIYLYRNPKDVEAEKQSFLSMF